eukprot:Hpha_TRINITY_DN32190_c0_g1::TRINITY_DN32190_c0_g1_i1::g.18434::m.18434
MLDRPMPEELREQWQSAVEENAAARREAALAAERCVAARLRQCEAAGKREALTTELAKEKAVAAAGVAAELEAMQPSLQEVAEERAELLCEAQHLRREGRRTGESAEAVSAHAKAVASEAEMLVVERQRLREYIGSLNTRLRAKADAVRELRRRARTDPALKTEDLAEPSDDEDADPYDTLPPPASPRAVRRRRQSLGTPQPGLGLGLDLG